MLTWKQLAKNVWLDLSCQIMPAHLLWAFSWLKGYSSYEVHTGQIKWENRLMGGTGQHSLTKVDGADFKINEQTPFSSKW
eukprot:4122464-Ditylum_brightwellii.AAC.1